MTEGGAYEQYMQWSGRCVRARTALRGTSASRAPTVDAAFSNKLESFVVSTPDPFGRDLALEFESDIRCGQFGEGAFELRFIEIEGIVSDRWGGTLLVDQVREGEEDVGGLPERPTQYG